MTPIPEHPPVDLAPTDPIVQVSADIVVTLRDLRNGYRSIDSGRQLVGRALEGMEELVPYFAADIDSVMEIVSSMDEVCETLHRVLGVYGAGDALHAAFALPKAS
jgi:hypothetical protein